MTESPQESLFIEPKRSAVPKLLAAVAALVITGLLFAGYTLLRKRYVQNYIATPGSTTTVEPRQTPKALILVDEALLQGGKSTLGGTVKNTSAERLEGLSVELELKRRKDGGTENQSVALNPAQLEPAQEGRYSLELRAQDYSSARLVGLKAGSGLLAYTTAQGQKRPPERLGSKTITTGKPASKRGEFLNSEDNPARVP
jgi:hypothetical protein